MTGSVASKWMSLVFLPAVFAIAAAAQPGDASAAHTKSKLISMPGATFTVDEKDLSRELDLIVYGDMRFTDPANTRDANPVARKALIEKIAKEHPDAVQLTGDVPLAGGRTADYAQYATETESWRTGKLRVYPALGNHELAGTENKQAAIENWWAAFPELRDRRWYSVQLGRRVYLLNLDSTSDITPGSEQRRWIEDQVEHLNPKVQFVFIALHHPPVADIATLFAVDHNPRPNEISLRDYLSGVAKTVPARFIVTAGHIHNYERFETDGVTYLVSGGGGAKPYPVERTPIDAYQSIDLPNFHYIKFSLRGKEMKATMYRLAYPITNPPVWEAKDKFTVKAR